MENGREKFFAGVDVGSTTTEMVVIDGGKNIRATSRTATAGDVRLAAHQVYEDCRRQLLHPGEDRFTVFSTGYGRAHVAYAGRALSEIICYGIGVHHLDVGVRTIIDIGGQDAKAIRIDDQGKVQDFAMNDKCAAGTGRFLEMLAHSFRIELDALAECAAASQKTLKISATCAVFAESEMISLIARGENRNDLLAAAHVSVAERVAALVRQIGLRPPLMFCGGVARNRHLGRVLARELGVEPLIPEDCEMVGALGAALLAVRETA
ncbi:MAG: 2-hydroxyglutaryl-CoA dehydratase [Deltaproteobacteria bacterium]|nr:2-hydroxyglutaryl-CoA dehydratase [Deltaproteobacteria bacterium]